jgi:hypothetical protein
MKTPLDIYKLLPGKNCGDCRVSTCIAFAAAVIRQERRLADCPHADRSAIALTEGMGRHVNLESIQEETTMGLRARIRLIDLLSRTESLGGRISGDALVITCLGKDFEVDRSGKIKSDCHTHTWFSIPVLDYILTGTGIDVSGTWTPFRELPNGQNWSRLFEQRCEKPMKEIADAHPELFEDLISMFSARTSSNAFNSDISVVLYPLPKVPVLICYWKPEDGMDSKLHLFFDDTAESHLHIGSLFTLVTGITIMLEKIMLKHGRGNGHSG